MTDKLKFQLVEATNPHKKFQRNEHAGRANRYFGTHKSHLTLSYQLGVSENNTTLLQV